MARQLASLWSPVRRRHTHEWCSIHFRLQEVAMEEFLFLILLWRSEWCTFHVKLSRTNWSDAPLRYNEWQVRIIISLWNFLSIRLISDIFSFGQTGNFYKRVNVSIVANISASVTHLSVPEVQVILFYPYTTVYSWKICCSPVKDLNIGRIRGCVCVDVVVVE